jgi:hypothetical protein
VAVALGEPEKSRLIEALRYKNPDLEIPPKRQLPNHAALRFFAGNFGLRNEGQDGHRSKT